MVQIDPNILKIPEEFLEKFFSTEHRVSLEIVQISPKLKVCSQSQTDSMNKEYNLFSLAFKFVPYFIYKAFSILFYSRSIKQILINNVAQASSIIFN